MSLKPEAYTKQTDEMNLLPGMGTQTLKNYMLPLTSQYYEDIENNISGTNLKLLRKATGRKGVLKRFQESVELMEWKYSEISLEEELKTTVPVLELGKGPTKSTLLWTEADRKYIAEKCEHKLPIETFCNETVIIDDETIHNIQKMTVEACPAFLNCLLGLNGTKLRPVFENIRIDSTKVHRNFLLSADRSTKIRATIIPNKTMLTEV